MDLVVPLGFTGFGLVVSDWSPWACCFFKVVGLFCWVVWFVGVRLWGIVLIFMILEF